MIINDRRLAQNRPDARAPELAYGIA